MCNPFDGTQLCATANPDFFFPEDRKDWKSNIAQAVALCAKCPMLAACRTYSDETVGLYGVWAGKWRDGAGFTSSAPYPTTNRKVA